MTHATRSSSNNPRQPFPAASIRRCAPSARSAARRVFFTRGKGAIVWDADGKSYIDYVGSWGPLILGHAHPEVVRRCRKPPRAACPSARRPSRTGDGRTAVQAGAEHGAGAPGELRHRGHHERHPPGARLHRPRQDRQVRRLLPRPRRQPAGEGRLRRADLRQPQFRPACRPKSPAHTLVLDYNDVAQARRRPSAKIGNEIAA